jgi:hypothetical protein
LADFGHCGVVHVRTQVRATVDGQQEVGDPCWHSIEQADACRGFPPARMRFQPSSDSAQPSSPSKPIANTQPMRPPGWSVAGPLCRTGTWHGVFPNGRTPARRSSGLSLVFARFLTRAAQASSTEVAVWKKLPGSSVPHRLAESSSGLTGGRRGAFKRSAP